MNSYIPVLFVALPLLLGHQVEFCGDTPASRPSTRHSDTEASRRAYLRELRAYAELVKENGNPEVAADVRMKHDEVEEADFRLIADTLMIVSADMALPSENDPVRVLVVAYVGLTEVEPDAIRLTLEERVLDERRLTDVRHGKHGDELARTGYISFGTPVDIEEMIVEEQPVYAVLLRQGKPISATEPVVAMR